MGPKGKDQAGAGGCKLRDGGGQSRACHAHVEHGNKEQIQPHVQKSGQGQEDQRCPAVSQSPQSGGNAIIESHGGKRNREKSR